MTHTHTPNGNTNSTTEYVKTKIDQKNGSFWEVCLLPNVSEKQKFQKAIKSRRRFHVFIVLRLLEFMNPKKVIKIHYRPATRHPQHQSTKHFLDNVHRVFIILYSVNQ